MYVYLNGHKYYVLYVHVFNMFQFFCNYSDFCVGASMLTYISCKAVIYHHYQLKKSPAVMVLSCHCVKISLVERVGLHLCNSSTTIKHSHTGLLFVLQANREMFAKIPFNWKNRVLCLKGALSFLLQ